MRNRTGNRFLLLFVLCTAGARAQNADWRFVKELVPGTPISVKYGRFFGHDRCIFENATEDALVCHRQLYGTSQLFIPAEAVFRRKLVREVRLEHTDASNLAVGALIGGAVGGALGAASSDDRRAHSRLALGLLFGAGGAGVGAITGRDFPIRHGAVIYRR